MKAHNIRKKLHSVNLKLRKIKLARIAKPTALCISALFIVSIVSAFALTPVQGQVPTYGQWHQPLPPSPTPSPAPTPSPTPTPSPNSDNLAPIPNGWTQSITGQRGIGGQPGDYLDTSVTFNGQPTLRIDLAKAPVVNGNLDPEFDSAYFSISPGDQIVFNCYVELSQNTISEKSYYGAVIDIDLYGTGPDGNGRICGTQSPNGSLITFQNGARIYPSNWGTNIVHFGTSTWAYVSIDFTVPKQAEADGFGGPNPAGTLCTVTGMIPTMFAYANIGEGAHAWFADTELYVTPPS